MAAEAGSKIPLSTRCSRCKKELHFKSKYRLPLICWACAIAG